MGRLDGIKSAISSFGSWLKKVFQKAQHSVEHVEAIREDFEWFEEKLDELEPEARLHLESMRLHFEELGKIWGF